MSSRKISPSIPTTTIVCDEFERGAPYTNWRPRGSGDWLLIYTAAGSGVIGLPGGPVRTRVGDLLLYEPDAAHDYGTAAEAARWRLLWAHFVPRPAWSAWLRWPEIGPKIRLVHLPSSSRRGCVEALKRMIRATRRPGTIQIELAFAALEEAVLIGRAAQAASEISGPDARVQRAVSFLIDHFKGPFHLPGLARACGLSVSRLSLLFHRDIGTTPRQFVEEQRFSHAAQLLRRTAMSIDEIARECGFSDPFYFTNRFRRRQGMSPTAFRAKARTI